MRRRTVVSALVRRVAAEHRAAARRRGAGSPSSVLISVVLPAPLGPSRPVGPGQNSPLTPLRARAAPRRRRSAPRTVPAAPPRARPEVRRCQRVGRQTGFRSSFQIRSRSHHGSGTFWPERPRKLESAPGGPPLQTSGKLWEGVLPGVLRELYVGRKTGVLTLQPQATSGATCASARWPHCERRHLVREDRWARCWCATACSRRPTSRRRAASSCATTASWAAC